MNAQTPRPEDVLRNISAQDFLTFGIHQVAYVRPVQQQGHMVWSLHAADGTALTVQNSSHLAAVMARQNDLEPVSLN
jgi:hypothetical protein